MSVSTLLHSNLLSFSHIKHLYIIQYTYYNLLFHFVGVLREMFEGGQKAYTCSRFFLLPFHDTYGAKQTETVAFSTEARTCLLYEIQHINYNWVNIRSLGPLTTAMVCNFFPLSLTPALAIALYLVLRLFIVCIIIFQEKSFKLTGRVPHTRWYYYCHQLTWRARK